MKRNYPSTQQQLYAIGRAAWQSCLDRIADFAALKAKYTALFVGGKQTAIDTAEALPDDEQRKQAAQLLREQMSVKAEDCRDKWQRLKLYIEEAYPENEQDIQLSAAGQAHYEGARQENWDSVKRLMIDGDAFITANSIALLAGNNMPATFAADFATTKTDFETLYTGYINATLDTEVKTQDKITANNNVYKDLTSMLKDGQRIYKDDEAVKNLFVFDQLLNDIAGPGIAGIRGLVKDAVTGLPIAGVLVTVFGTDYSAITDADGRFIISPMAAGIYTVIFTKVGYQTLQVPNVVVETGVIHTLNVELTPAP